MHKFFKHPWLIVGVIALITVFFALQLPRAQLDNNNIRFVPEDDTARVTMNAVEETFGSSVFVLVALEKKDGNLFEPAFLQQVKAYVDKIQSISIVGNVNSIVTADYITSRDDSIVVEKLVDDDFTGTAEQIKELKSRLASWDLYKNALVSSDNTATQILVPLEIDQEDAGKPEIVMEYTRVRDIAHEMFEKTANVYVTGIPMISATISEAMQTDLVTLIPIVAIVVLLTLFISFRRWTAVWLTLLTVLVSTLWAIGAMPLFGIKLTILSTVLPVILIAVGSAYGIHVLTFYINNMTQNLNSSPFGGGRVGVLTKEQNTEIVISVVSRVLKPVFLAALTTFAGFISFCFTRVVPIREWGAFASFGVLASFISSVTLIPAVLIIRGPKPMRSKKALQREAALAEKQADGLTVSGDTASLTRGLMAVNHHKKTTLIVTALLVLIAIYGASKLNIDNAFIEYFKSSTEIAKADKFVREKFGGSKLVELVMSADNAETLLSPTALGAMDGLSSYMQNSIPLTGKVMGFTDMVKRINQVFNADEPATGIISSRGGAEAQGSDDLSFGFDDFGFGDFTDDSNSDINSGNNDNIEDSNNISNNNSAPSAPPRENSYTVDDILRMLNTAATDGGSNMSAYALVEGLNKLTNYNGASYYEIPTDPAKYAKTTDEELQQIVSNYLMLLSGNISAYANNPLAPTEVKASIQLRATGNKDTMQVINEMQDYIDTHFPDTVKTIITGEALVEISLNDLIVNSQIISMVVSLLIVFLIMALSNKSIVAGIFGSIPLAIALLFNFAIMGWTGIKLNIGTSLIASLAVGIGVDYTIHMLETYKMEYKACNGKGDFLKRTFETAGMAIITNAASVGLGFAVLLLSQFTILQNLGFLVAITMFVSAIISLTVIPALLTMVKPKFISK
ncbi:MAG: MMPL family transporter [Spirochaetaceae bacterium]|jgi:predicted RND superfamily exporter protein|nr:MMPL family transporter [Spirochaetaceae bacterium]